MAFHVQYGNFNFELIDLIRYILGIYKIKDNQVVITSREIYPQIKKRELAFTIIKSHYETMLKERRCFNRYDFAKSFAARRGDGEYVTSSFSRTIINLNELNNVGKEDLEQLAKWGLLTLDVEGLYHFNHETYSILLFTLDFDERFYNIFDVCQFFKASSNEKERKIFFQRLINNYNGVIEIEDKITSFIDKFNYILSNYGPNLTENSLLAFRNYCDELELFKGLYEEKTPKLGRKK